MILLGCAQWNGQMGEDGLPGSQDLLQIAVCTHTHASKRESLSTHTNKSVKLHGTPPDDTILLTIECRGKENQSSKGLMSSGSQF